jgi:nicotinic acid phosphoribosyltransferase
MFFRKVPDGGGFAIMAGVEQLVDYLNNLKFTDDDIEYLRSNQTTKILKSITTNKKILKVWCKRNMSTHTDWTGTRVETINACSSINEFVDKLWNYLEEESDKMD